MLPDAVPAPTVLYGGLSKSHSINILKIELCWSLDEASCIEQLVKELDGPCLWSSVRDTMKRDSLSFPCITLHTHTVMQTD